MIYMHNIKFRASDATIFRVMRITETDAYTEQLLNYSGNLKTRKSVKKLFRKI